MSKALQKGKNNYLNYLTVNNGCKAVHTVAKPLPHHNPQNILTDNIRQVWLSNELPAVCIIDMRNAIEKPTYFNRIGFYCWHQYESNPKLAEIQYTAQDNPENAVWVVLTKIRLQLSSGWQHFKLPVIASKNISYLKIKITQNYAQPEVDQNAEQTHEPSTYLNQISLGYVEQIIESRVQLTTAANQNINANLREKTFSDYRKVAPAEKQVKKLAQKVKQLSGDNQTMRRTIDHQNSIIMKLQDAVQTLAENVSKLQKIQTLQEEKIKHLQGNRPTQQRNHPYLHQNRHQGSHSKRPHSKMPQFFADDSYIVPSLQEKQNHYSRQKQRSNHTSIYEQQQSSHHQPSIPHHHTSTHKSTNNKQKSNQKSNNSKPKQVINAGSINSSGNSLSEYEGVVDQRAYRYGKGRPKGDYNRNSSSKEEATYIPMLEKLQELIILRDEKRNRLKTQKKPLRHGDNIVVDSDGEEDLMEEESDD